MKSIKKLVGYLLYNITCILPHYQLGRTWRIPKAIRAFCGKLLFEECGEAVDIGRKIRLSSHIKLGNNSGIGDYSFLQGNIEIGNDVIIAPNCTFIAANHNTNDLDKLIRSQGMIEKKIVVGNNVWIGYGCIILGGSIIKDGAVIAAGAVVTGIIEENEIVGGIPARHIRYRGE